MPAAPAPFGHKTEISQFNANRPELAAICARILSLQSADWIAGTVSRSLSLPWKIAFPDPELGSGSLDCEALTKHLGLHQRGARDFFDALVALELLDRDAQGRYANRPCHSWIALPSPR
jgi:hypothetical protein